VSNGSIQRGWPGTKEIIEASVDQPPLQLVLGASMVTETCYFANKAPAWQWTSDHRRPASPLPPATPSLSQIPCCLEVRRFRPERPASQGSHNTHNGICLLPGFVCPIYHRPCWFEVFHGSFFSSRALCSRATPAQQLYGI